MSLNTDTSLEKTASYTQPELCSTGLPIPTLACSTLQNSSESQASGPNTPSPARSSHRSTILCLALVILIALQTQFYDFSLSLTFTFTSPSTHLNSTPSAPNTESSWTCASQNWAPLRSERQLHDIVVLTSTADLDFLELRLQAHTRATDTIFVLEPGTEIFSERSVRASARFRPFQDKVAWSNTLGPDAPLTPSHLASVITALDSRVQRGDILLSGPVAATANPDALALLRYCDVPSHVTVSSLDGMNELDAFVLDGDVFPFDGLAEENWAESELESRESAGERAILEDLFGDW